ncbi:MAG TPA: caspase family protein, partial [Stenomitos sp.]
MQTRGGDLRPGTAPRNIGREGDRTALAAAFNLAPMSLPRRDFLRHIGLFSAALWLGDDIMAQRYRSVLAQTTPRKLALLVGVDQYPRFASVPALKGCATDVELHCELLVHRFGFNRSDVLMLTADAATRSNIEAAFATHLADQVRPGDIVVFHFSGYGCMVRTQPTGAPSYSDQKALLPIDSWVPNPIADQPPLFNGIYEDTLFLLLRTLKTNGVVTLLDLGVQPILDLRCRSLRERSLPLWTTTELSIAELILQERLLQQTQLTRDQIQAQRQAGQLPGLVLAAASDAQPTALERDENQGAAGVFTSSLTQRLWDSSPATTL